MVFNKELLTRVNNDEDLKKLESYLDNITNFSYIKDIDYNGNEVLYYYNHGGETECELIVKDFDTVTQPYCYLPKLDYMKDEFKYRFYSVTVENLLTFLNLLKNPAYFKSLSLYFRLFNKDGVKNPININILENGELSYMIEDGQLHNIKIVYQEEHHDEIGSVEDMYNEKMYNNVD